MTRIVGGTLGRPAAGHPGGGDHPADRRRRCGRRWPVRCTATGGLDGARVLDLYAGSGALGLELVSRGASSAVFVEHDRAALTALRANVAALGAATGPR